MLGFGSGAANLRTVVVAYQVTDRGLIRLGSRTVDSEGGKSPGMVVPLAMAAVTHNPIGLLVSGAVLVVCEKSGSSTIEGSAKRTVKERGEQRKTGFKKQGWIDSRPLAGRVKGARTRELVGGSSRPLPTDVKAFLPNRLPRGVVGG